MKVIFLHRSILVLGYFHIQDTITTSCAIKGIRHCHLIFYICVFDECKVRPTFVFPSWDVYVRHSPKVFEYFLHHINNYVALDISYIEGNDDLDLLELSPTNLSSSSVVNDLEPLRLPREHFVSLHRLDH